MGQRVLNNLSIYILALIIVIVNVPVLSRVVSGGGILVLMLLFVLLNIYKYTRNKRIYVNAIIITLAYIALEIAYEFLGKSHLSLVYYYYTISFLFFAFAVSPTLSKMDRHEQNILLTAAMGSLLYAMFDNLRLRLQYGTRYIGLGDIVTGTNAISTQYFSAIVLIAGVMLTESLFSKKHRILSLLMFIATVLFEVFVGQRTIAILLLAIMIVFQLLVLQKRSLGAYVLTVIIILAVVLVVVNAESALLWISGVLNNERISNRISQLLYVIRVREIQGAGGSLEVRFNLIMNSIRTFLKSPGAFLVGVGDNRNTNLIIGHHSQWVDQTAKYGVIGSLLLFASLKSCFRALRSTMSLEDMSLKKHFMIFEIYFIVRGLLGYVMYPYFGIALFVVIPIILMRLDNINIGNVLYGGKK